jgi:hypothetical protein
MTINTRRSYRTANWPMRLMTLWGHLRLGPTSIWQRVRTTTTTRTTRKLYTSSIGSYPDRHGGEVQVELHASSERARSTSSFATRSPSPSVTCSFSFYGMCVRSFVNNREKHWDSLVALILHVVMGLLYRMVHGAGRLFLLGFIHTSAHRTWDWEHTFSMLSTTSPRPLLRTRKDGAM